VANPEPKPKAKKWAGSENTVFAEGSKEIPNVKKWSGVLSERVDRA
jgi:hypothetical protein